MNNYMPAMSDLGHGSALNVEDLNVTMNLVVFQVPLDITRSQLNRLIKNLEIRDLTFSLIEKTTFNEWPYSCYVRRAELTVGDRTVIFEVY